MAGKLSHRVTVRDATSAGLHRKENHQKQVPDISQQKMLDVGQILSFLQSAAIPPNFSELGFHINSRTHISVSAPS